MSWVSTLLERAWFSTAPLTGPKHAALKTRRLRLLAVTPQMLESELRGDARLAELLDARVTAEWPPQAWDKPLLSLMLQQMRDDPEGASQLRYVVLHQGSGTPRTLVGAVGAFARSRGEVEIAYSTLSEFQRAGFATEAVSAFVAHLLEQKDVTCVSAQSSVATPESIKVMERCGMSDAGAGDENGTVRFRRKR